MSNLDRRTVTAGLSALAGLAGSNGAKAATPAMSWLVVGDWGRRGESHQREVGRAMETAAAELASRFVLSVGDNFYPDGVESVTDSHWKESFNDVYSGPHLQTPWYVALGNHDYHGNPQAQLDYARTSPRWRMPKRYYKVDDAGLIAAGVDLFCLDTSPMLDDYAERISHYSGKPVVFEHPAEQLAWLDAALGASKARWKLVYGHHTIRSGGSGHGDTPELVARLLPILQKHGVQAYICGHDHDLQHIVRDDLHYLLVGAGSEVRPVRPVKGTKFCKDVSGFAALTVHGAELSFSFRDVRNAVLYQAVIPQTA